MFTPVPPKGKNLACSSILGVCTSQSLVTTPKHIVKPGVEIFVFLFHDELPFVHKTNKKEQNSGAERVMAFSTPVARGYVLHCRWANACAKKTQVPWRQMTVVTNINEPDLAPL